METGTLKELNVQPGDVVKSLETSSMLFKEGKCYHIQEQCKITDEFGDTDPVGLYGHLFRIVSRAKPAGPVRTVTRKEIVPGVYGQLRVYPDGEVRIVASTLEVRNIRAAIATLTEIADALEGGSDV